jgi:peptidyl-Lys metalloendopeptidase
MNRLAKLTVLVAVVLLVAVSPLQAAPDSAQRTPLATSLEVSQYAHGPADEIAITFAAHNGGQESVYILKWQTPFDGIEADLFEVSCDGEPVAYTGKLIKRAEPEPADFLEIKAGETRTAVFDPSAVYDMSRTCQYTVRYRNGLASLLNWDDDEGAPEDGRVRRRRKIAVADVVSNEVSLFVEGRETSPEPFALETFGGSTGCSNTQVSTVQTAHSNAQTMSTKAKSWLAANPDSYALYIRWFGSYASTRYNTVKSHYNAIVDAFANKSVTYDCSTCTIANAYAYVYASQPYKIYLCGYFWKAPATGRDSKAGTLVHEMSHFRVTAGTSDYVYGESGALNLARTNPKKAIANADNHEYFAEDQK